MKISTLKLNLKPEKLYESFAIKALFTTSWKDEILIEISETDSTFYENSLLFTKRIKCGRKKEETKFHYISCLKRSDMKLWGEKFISWMNLGKEFLLIRDKL